MGHAVRALTNTYSTRKQQHNQRFITDHTGWYEQVDANIVLAEHTVMLYCKT